MMGGGGGGDDRCPRRGSEADRAGGGCGIPPPKIGSFYQKLEYQNRILEHLKRCFKELNVFKVHGEELP